MAKKKPEVVVASGFFSAKIVLVMRHSMRAGSFTESICIIMGGPKGDGLKNRDELLRKFQTPKIGDECTANPQIRRNTEQSSNEYGDSQHMLAKIVFIASRVRCATSFISVY